MVLFSLVVTCLRGYCAFPQLETVYGNVKLWVLPLVSVLFFSRHSFPEPENRIVLHGVMMPHGVIHHARGRLF